MTGRKYFLNCGKGVFSEPRQAGVFQSFTEITGHLVNVNFKETDFGEVMRLHVVNEFDFYVLSMFVHSRSANAFFLMLKNIDLHSEMTFKIKSVDGKDFFRINQFGGPVLWYYTNENTGELPALVHDKRDFFKNLIKSETIPALQAKENPYPSHPLYKPYRTGLNANYFDDFKDS